MNRKNDEISEEARKMVEQLTSDFKRALQIIRERLPNLIDREKQVLSGSKE